MPREKSRYRDRRSLSNSSNSSYDKRPKNKHKRRSRSRNKSEINYKRKRSNSRLRNKKRSYSRSPSKDRRDLKCRRRSSSKSRSKKSHRRSVSRQRSLSRSRSRSKVKHSRSKHKNRHSSRSSSSGSNSFDIERPLVKNRNIDDTESKIEKAIKAAEAAGLTMTKIPTYEYKKVEVKEDMPTIQDRNLLAELNNESFVQKSFTSSRNKKYSQNIVIDLNTETVKVPEAEAAKDDSILNFAEIPSEEELKEMWIKKLYQYRKKMLKGEI